VAGKRVRQIDLRADIVGCRASVFRPTILNVTADNGEHFVVLSAEAPANCEAEHRCGGAPDSMTLVWLAIRADLSLESKQVFVIEDCWEDRALDGEPVDNGDWDEWREKLLSQSHGAFTMNFAESTADGEVSGRVTYNRRAARSGLQITRSN